MEATLNDKLTDIEKARLKDFKKHYEANLDADGNGTIKLNNETVKVHSKTNGDVASSDVFTGDLNLHMRKFLRIPDAKDREAVLQHEFGHRKLHTVYVRGEVVDLTRLDDELREQIRDDLIEMARFNGTPKNSPFVHNIKIHSRLSIRKKDLESRRPDLIEKRKEFRNKLKHLVVPDSHATLLEFEADQYAANKVGAKQMVHALQTMDGLDKEFDEIDVDERLRELEETKIYKKANEEKKKELRQFVIDNINTSDDPTHEVHTLETKVREHALNKKDIDQSIRKAFTD